MLLALNLFLWRDRASGCWQHPRSLEDLYAGPSATHLAPPYSPDLYPPEDLQAARTEMSRGGLAVDGASPRERWEAVFRFVREGLLPHKGQAPSWLRKKSALEQWRMVRSGECLAYCAQFTKCLALFGAAAGLAVREVGSTYADGQGAVEHAFNEVYLPDVGKWVYTDADLNTLCVESGEGKLLSASDLLEAHASRGSAGLSQRRIDGSGWTTEDYWTSASLNQRFLDPRAVLVFNRQYRDAASITAVLDRYVFDPEPGYSLEPRSWQYRVQRVSVLSTAVVALLLGLGLVRWFFRGRRMSSTAGVEAEGLSPPVDG